MSSNPSGYKKYIFPINLLKNYKLIEKTKNNKKRPGNDLNLKAASKYTTRNFYNTNEYSKKCSTDLFFVHFRPFQIKNAILQRADTCEKRFI